MARKHTSLIALLLAAFIGSLAPLQATEPPGIAQAFASLQRNGKPYKTFYNNYIAPHAVLENDTVFTAHQDGEGRPVIDAYDIERKTWLGPVRASDFGLGADTHGNPSICIDTQGYLHVFFGCHGRAMKQVRSKGRPANDFPVSNSESEGCREARPGKSASHSSFGPKKPYDITAWEEMPSPTRRATYPQTMRMADGSIYLFYRAGGHLEPWSMRISRDDGRTWSDQQPIIEMRKDFPDKKACSYNAFVPGADYRTVHCFWVYKDDDPRGNQRKYQGLHEAVYRYNLYYAKRTAEGQWIAADGTPMSALPVNKTFCDAHAILFDSGEEFTAPSRIVIGAGDTPYIRFSHGVSDWKNGKLIVPSKYKYATAVDGKWRITEQKSDEWPEPVRDLLTTPGPAAFGGQQPNPWFIHFKEAPPEDASATYVWLGHVESGYATRTGGAAASP